MPDFLSMGSKMNCAIYYVPQITFNFFKNSVPRLKNEPLKVLKLIVGRIFWIEISFFNIFWQKKTGQNTFKISLPYLENELRHLCPLNPIPMPDFFRWVQKCISIVIPRQEAVAPSMSEKEQLWCLSWWFCLLSWDHSDRCGIFWLGLLMDGGRYEGVAPSMWAFAALFWRMSGSCAIYVPKNDLFFAIFYALNLPLCLAPESGPHQVPRKRTFSWVSQRKLDTWWGPFSGANPSGKLALRWFPPIFFLNIKLPFWDIDGATPTHSPKSGWECPHRWRNSLISPSIHQPT